MIDIEKIIENHNHFLKKDCAGWEKMRADLRGAYLRGVDLRYADLRDANLKGADLTCANLRDANLEGADLEGANLTNANLKNAYLRGVNLRDANLEDANLRGANLTNANLRDADLEGANLEGANLEGANLIYTEGLESGYHKGKILTENIIGYKKCKDNIIVTLEIPRGAIVFSINGSKYRANKARVKAIENGARARSMRKHMTYYVGDEFTIYNFNCEYNKECAEGIHFFLTREEAEKYTFY